LYTEEEMFRLVFMGSEGPIPTSIKIVEDLATHDSKTPFLFVDASENSGLTNYLFDSKVEALDKKRSFDQLLCDLVIHDGNIASLNLGDYMVKLNNYTNSYVIPSFGRFHLYREGLYGITRKTERYPRANMTFQKALLTSLDGLVNKFAFDGHIWMDTHSTLDIITQMAIVASRHVKTTSKECIPRIQEWLNGYTNLDPILRQHEFASICRESGISLPRLLE
jgi:hypothetical protein